MPNEFAYHNLSLNTTGTEGSKTNIAQIVMKYYAMEYRKIPVTSPGLMQSCFFLSVSAVV